MAAISIAAMSPVRAQGWPGGAVTIIVPYTPGGAADTLARMIQDGLSKRLGQSLLIEIKPGGSGIPGTDMVVRSSDGLTIGLIVSVHATSVALKMSLPYDPLNDITPLSLLGRVPLILVVHPSVKATTPKELIEEARSRGKKMFAATSGIGTAGHFAVKFLNLNGGVQIEPVRYKGAAPAVQDLIGGQVQLQFATLSSVWPHVEAGSLRALAVSTATRSALRPELPTMAEAAGIEGFNFAEWYGIVGPASMPPENAAKLRDAIVQTLEDSLSRISARNSGSRSRPPRWKASEA
ncbi:Bug family tripartite tricarboxylate transporter substrate binding protein [Pontitalea aquivivens]|uniref:Bug family tripartite tricarboxylate transporter substrate binding protein n=1 Tax=Pontitalea aquivivens TaxID=3388663 RepID=UPI0039705847